MRHLLILFLSAVGLLAGEGHLLKPAEGKAMIQAYQVAKAKTQAVRSNLTMAPVEGSFTQVSDLQSVTYPATAVLALLSQPGAANFRVYKALNNLLQETFVLVAVDANGKDLMTESYFVVDNGSPCPPLCPDVPPIP